VLYTFVRIRIKNISMYPIEYMENTKKSLCIFVCEPCSYECNNKKDYNKHLLTKKHCNVSNSNENKLYICDTCNKPYKYHSGLWKHKKDCKAKTIEEVNYVDIIKQLLTQNNELKNFIVEQAQEHKKETTDILNRVIDQANENKKDTVDIINKVIENTKPTNITNTTNNNNKAFNINLFLNETCKDAINFSDFIKQLEVSREDLENNAQLGFVDGVSKILIESLKQLDKTERPIHCTDVKRETMYIKDEDKWNKEEDSTKLNQAIQEVTRKSMRTLLDWKEENPDYKDNDSDFSNLCITIQKNSMAAHNRDTYFPKVIKAVAKEVIVDK
jgi:hypothetical protein